MLEVPQTNPRFNDFLKRCIKFQPLVVLTCLVAKLCPTPCNLMVGIPWGSSVHGIFQERILEGVAISFSRRFSWPRGQSHISCVFCTGRWILYQWATWEVLLYSWLWFITVKEDDARSERENVYRTKSEEMRHKFQFSPRRVTQDPFKSRNKALWQHVNYWVTGKFTRDLEAKVSIGVGHIVTLFPAWTKILDSQKKREY